VITGQRVIISAGKKAKPDIPIPLRDGKPIIKDTSDLLPTRTDSLVKIANKLLATNAKIITVKGITPVTEDTISIYNNEKIRVAAAFDRQGNYTYELAIPLKYLHLPDGVQKFNYSVKLLGRLANPKGGMVTRYIYQNHQMVDIDQDLDATTDFWGEYTLAKNKND